MGGITVTGAAQQAAWAGRRTPAVEQVRPGVWSIPIHFDAPVRHTFCYAITNDAGEAIIIDPGWDSSVGRSALDAGLCTAGIRWNDVVGVVATHFHPDHLGMVAHVGELTGAWVGLSAPDAAVLDAFIDADRVLRTDRAWFARLGAPQHRLPGLVIRREQVLATANLARPDLILADGDVLPLRGRALTIVATPGHTPGHVCIVDDEAGLVFTGDHVLPRITPNVGMTSTGGNPRALKDYLASLLRMSEWDDHEVCPAHEYRFSGLATRAAQLLAHHEERSNEIVLAVESGAASVWRAAERISWSRPWSAFDGINLRAALSETSAHVDYLVSENRLGRTTAGGQDVLTARSAESQPSPHHTER